MTSLPCDIVLLPEPDIAAKAIAVSQRLGTQFDALYTLKDGAYFPHMSLYMTQLKLDGLDNVKALLAAIAKQAPVFSLNCTRYYQAHGYIDAEPATLTALQMAVIDAINPIRDGLREKDKARMLTETGKVRESLEKYGYRGVGELFRPHVTLTRFADETIIDVTNASLPQTDAFTGRFTRLGLFEMGDNGTCVRKIAEFKLGTSL